MQAKLSLLEHCMVGGPSMKRCLTDQQSGVLTAEGLALVFADLFGGVVYAGIDTDRFK